MTPRTEVVLGRGHICQKVKVFNSLTSFYSRNLMQLSYEILDSYLFNDGPVDMKI